MARYNGWANYETWATKLWLDNDYETYKSFSAMARKAQRQGLEPWEFGRQVKEELEQSMPDLGASLWQDLLGSAFGEVDWTEIAEAYFEETEETEEHQTEAQS